MKKHARFLATLLAAVLLVAAALPSAFAFKYTAVAGKSTTFDKYLVMDVDANVPNATFAFTVAPGTAIAATEDRVAVLAGIGIPTIADVTFAPTDSTTAGLPSDTDTATAGQQYATQTATVDFSGISFTEPGIYRYIVTETATTNQGVTNDESATRTLDVYVTDNDGALEVSSYVLHTGTDAPAAGTDKGSADVSNTGDKLGDKSAGYTNTYDTSNLTFSKTVSGNQASRDKYFAFTVTIRGAVAGTVYDVDLTKADVNISANPNDATTCIGNAVTQPQRLTVPADGTVTQVFYLQHGQEITIKGLAKGTEYAVTENPEDYKRTAPDNASGTIVSEDVTAAFTNTRSGVIPTGVLLTVAPFAAIMAVGAVGILVMVGKKRKRAE